MVEWHQGNTFDRSWENELKAREGYSGPDAPLLSISQKPVG